MSTQSKKLRGSKLLNRHRRYSEDSMSSMGNLMDVMLVFACGLLIALITHYNVGITSASDIGTAEVLEGELTAAQEGSFDSSDTYAELSMVYQDLDIGELYAVAPHEDDEAGEE